MKQTLLSNSIKVSLLFLLFSLSIQAQHYYIPLNNEYMSRFDSSLYKVGVPFHTSLKPYMSEEIEAVIPIDTLEAFKMKDSKFMNSLVGRKLFRQHLVQVREDDYFLYGDINFEFNGGQSMEDEIDKNCFINSRGISVGGTFGKHFSFASSFVESQSTFSTYLDTTIRKILVVPGGARIKNYEGKFDYGTATGTISYSLKKHFSFQFGHDKNFIGDGYRSFLLSDNSFNYPFLKINANFWKIKYMVLYTLMQDGPYISPNDNQAFWRKYGTFHYLDFNIGKRFTFGVLEAIIWDHDSSRAFDLNYLNPVIFLRPVDFASGSPDNAVLGFNLKFKLSSRLYMYGQMMLDEFKKDEYFSGDGWWGNKQAYQVGFRAFSLFGIRKLDVMSEFNYARPYIYQHRATTTSYTHYNQALAHPMGGNFWESVSSINYSIKRWNVMFRGSYARIGYDVDSSGAIVNYGNNVLYSYDTRPSNYGNETLQGLETAVFNGELRLWYLLNPASNMVIEAGTRMRQTDNRYGKTRTLFIYFGIRTNLTNRYFDF